MATHVGTLPRGQPPCPGRPGHDLGSDVVTTSQPRPWMEAWQDALYGPYGFYRSPAGPAAHFLTATHGALGWELAHGILAYLEHSGMPVRTILDIGAGRGELATALVQAGAERSAWADTSTPGLSPRVVALAVVSRPHGLDERVGWIVSPGGPDLPDDLGQLAGTAVIAHEW